MAQKRLSVEQIVAKLRTACSSGTPQPSSGARPNAVGVARVAASLPRRNSDCLAVSLNEDSGAAPEARASEQPGTCRNGPRPTTAGLATDPLRMAEARGQALRLSHSPIRHWYALKRPRAVNRRHRCRASSNSPTPSASPHRLWSPRPSDNGPRGVVGRPPHRALVDGDRHLRGRRDKYPNTSVVTPALRGNQAPPSGPARRPSWTRDGRDPSCCLRFRNR